MIHLKWERYDLKQLIKVVSVPYYHMENDHYIWWLPYTISHESMGQLHSSALLGWIQLMHAGLSYASVDSC